MVQNGTEWLRNLKMVAKNKSIRGIWEWYRMVQNDTAAAAGAAVTNAPAVIAANTAARTMLRRLLAGRVAGHYHMRQLLVGTTLFP